MDDQLAFSSPNCNNFYSGRKKVSLKYGIKLHGLWICRCRSTGSRPQFRVMVSIYSWPASKSVYCMPPNLYDEKNVGLSCRPLHGTHCPHDLMMCCSSCSPLFFSPWKKFCGFGSPALMWSESFSQSKPPKIHYTQHTPQPTGLNCRWPDWNLFTKASITSGVLGGLVEMWQRLNVEELC